MAARDVIFLRDLLLDLGVIVDAPSVIQSDSKSAIDMSLDPVAFKKTKHILRAAEFLRDLVARDLAQKTFSRILNRNTLHLLAFSIRRNFIKIASKYFRFWVKYAPLSTSTVLAKLSLPTTF